MTTSLTFQSMLLSRARRHCTFSKGKRTRDLKVYSHELPAYLLMSDRYLSPSLPAARRFVAASLPLVEDLLLGDAAATSDQRLSCDREAILLRLLSCTTSVLSCVFIASHPTLTALEYAGAWPVQIPLCFFFPSIFN